MLFVFEGRWTWNELADAVSIANLLLGPTQYEVDIIAEMSRSTWVPPRALAHLRRIASRIHPRTGVLVVVGGPRFLPVLGDMFARLYRHLAHDAFFTDSMKEARQFIADYRSHRPG